VLGYLLNDFFERMFARPVAAAGFLLATAALLSLSERFGKQVVGRAQALPPVDALLIGLAQAAAMLPGISRSGATIAAGLFRGMERSQAARFSFLLGIPVVVGAGVFEIAHLVSSGGLGQAAPSLAIGFAAALGVGIGSIRFLMRQLKRGRLYPYAVYCAGFGLVCLVVAAVRAM
jgi:undecaprenyl-diphosphatase